MAVLLERIGLCLAAGLSISAWAFAVQLFAWPTNTFALRKRGR
jgi:hypothetical protein